MEHSNKLTHSRQQELVRSKQLLQQQLMHSYGSLKVSANKVREIERNNWDQRVSPLWFSVRHCRLTTASLVPSSIFFTNAMQRMEQHHSLVLSTNTDQLLLLIIWSCLSYGKEDLALKLYNMELTINRSSWENVSHTNNHIVIQVNQLLNQDFLSPIHIPSWVQPWRSSAWSQWYSRHRLFCLQKQGLQWF